MGDGRHATMNSFQTLLLSAALVCASAEVMLLHTNTPENDPHHTHCEDVKADMSDHNAQQWWAANAYAYPASKGWTKGSLCDQKVYPAIEHQNSPIGVHSVVLRRLGSSALSSSPPKIIRKYNVGD